MTLRRAGFTDPKPAEADHPEKAHEAIAEAFSPTLALGARDIIYPSGFKGLGAPLPPPEFTC